MSIILTIFVFLLVLFIVVIVHEFGHFIMAKKSNIKVEEFAVGFPPNIISKKYKDTEYKLNWIPLGGYVKLLGEHLSDPEAEGSFKSAPPFKKLIVTLAGPAFNVFLAVIAFIVVLLIGAQSLITEENVEYLVGNQEVLLTETVEGSQIDGQIPEGSIIPYIIVDGEKIDINSIEQLEEYIQRNNKIIFSYKNNSQIKEVVIESLDDDLGGSFTEVGEVKYPLWKAVAVAFEHTFSTAGIIVIAVFDLIKDSISGDADFSNLAGPVGIAKHAGDAATNGISNFISFIGILSLNLAILNLIPFPALDGGRAVFVLYEMIFRRRVKPILESVLNTIGFIILIVLILLITMKDIVNLI